MKLAIFVLVAAAVVGGGDAYIPQIPSKAKLVAKEMGTNLKKAAVATATAAAFVCNPVDQAVAVDHSHSPLISLVQHAQQSAPTTFGSSSNLVSEKVVREGLYKDYEVDLIQEYDDARSTYKPAKETKSKKGKYTALLAVLIVGSFIIPMAQYFWYVRDDDSSDKFFAASEQTPDPEPPKKKGWF